MKITGAGTPPVAPGLDEAEAAGAPSVQKGGKVEGKFSAELERAGAAQPGVNEPGSLESTIAAELRSGQTTPDEAVARLIEQAVDRRVGAGASEALRDQVRTALREAVATDPMLAERLRRLGQAR